jgi:hypothetical protein
MIIVVDGGVHGLVDVVIFIEPCVASRAAGAQAIPVNSCDTVASFGIGAEPSNMLEVSKGGALDVAPLNACPSVRGLCDWGGQCSCW